MVGSVTIASDRPKGQFLSCLISKNALVFVNVYSCVSGQLKGVQLNPFKSDFGISRKTSFKGQT